MRSAEEVMEILAAFDPTGSLRDAAELADCSQRCAGSVASRPYLVTDNEKTVTVDHVAGPQPGRMAFARHNGLTVAACLPTDPTTKGGSEAIVRIAKTDLVPTTANLLPGYCLFAELHQACRSSAVR